MPPSVAHPIRKDANELPPAVVKLVSPGRPLPIKLKLARPATSCRPKPLYQACWYITPALTVCLPLTQVRSLLNAMISFSLPLLAEPPQSLYSLNRRFTRFWSQSGALGRQILSFQCVPDLTVAWIGS